ncbi:NAD-dependent epimerase/dehydratase family protein [Dinoroseobacter sp. PD6]|uniref:D-erythronate dehydrogenase n=1 Tax=Dinoroseobacter sp. PD6 TaxID=3028384 RepID=UPI00237C2EFA|nr:D-erythronate dehydrogenase [Dinoroseobacter sp. PD6]MDD9716776.1 NAD-dependent epimerase/dehydratase family protein [Dinoroseobacter sp. PD6]
MRAMIIGAAGMLGAKLSTQIAQGAVPGITDLVLVDRVAPAPVPGLPCQCLAADLGAAGAAAELAALAPDLVFHLAAVVSGQAEAEFDTGYAVNLDASRALFEALRALETRPRVVFASSLAVYGPPFPDVVPEDFVLRPASSYGTQKAMVELLLADYSRKGFLRGTSLRLPTVSIRPGAPNAAASGFLSGILREPLAGQAANCPVPDGTRVWIASPDVTVAGLAHAAALDWDRIAPHPVLNLRGISVTVGEMLAALEQQAGPDARALVSRNPDPAIARIVQSWPEAFVTDTAAALDFPVNPDFSAILREYIDQYA